MKNFKSFYFMLLILAMCFPLVGCSDDKTGEELEDDNVSIIGTWDVVREYDPVYNSEYIPDETWQFHFATDKTGYELFEEYIYTFYTHFTYSLSNNKIKTVVTKLEEFEGRGETSIGEITYYTILSITETSMVLRIDSNSEKTELYLERFK